MIRVAWLQAYTVQTRAYPAAPRRKGAYHRPRLEVLEERALPSTGAPLPDISMQSATEDRHGIVADYTIAGAPVTAALTFAVYRSASPAAYRTSSPIATITLPASDSVDLSQGAHHIHLT